MNKITIDCTIQSLDSTQTFTTNGDYRTNVLTFDDPTGDTHTIILNKTTVDYYKKGSVDLHFTFDTTMLTKGEYTVYQHHFEFAVFTEYIILKDNHVSVKYKLMQDHEFVNETSIDVKYEFI